MAVDTVAPMHPTASPARSLRRETVPSYDEDSVEVEPRQMGRRGFRLRFSAGVVPRSIAGRVAAGCGLLLVIGIATGIYLAARHLLTHDDRFTIPSSNAIQIEGNTHLSRAQLLSIFGGDVERNVFAVPLAQRRADLESLPWIQHATVMRLLPNQLRISIVERTPVAFVRQGTRIGLADASGILLDIPTDAPGNPRYSFPVVTGLSAEDPQSTRTARIKIYQRFLSDLQGAGQNTSEALSEVDLSDPEDIKALIPDRGGEILVHFGNDNFVERYNRYKELLPEWRQQYPKLASVDMRYERQVVLEMQPGTSTPVAGTSAVPPASSLTASTAAPAVAKAVVPPAVKPAATKPAAPAVNAKAATPASPATASKAKEAAAAKAHAALLARAGHGPKLAVAPPAAAFAHPASKPAAASPNHAPQAVQQ